MIDLWLLAAKFVFLALLYGFLLWAVRAIWREADRDENLHTTSPEFFITIAPKNKAGRSYRLADETFIGRTAENEIVVDDPSVSATHSRLFRKSGSWFIEDLGSSNGTFVNDRKITKKQGLRDGDVVKVGRTEFSLRSRGEAN